VSYDLPASLVRYGTDLEAAIKRELASDPHGNSYRRPQRIAGATAVLTLPTAAVVALLVTGGTAASLVTRAYAAIAGSGKIVHFVESVSRTPARLGDRVSIEIWSSGPRTRSIVTLRETFGGEPLVIRSQLISDGTRLIAIAGSQLEVSDTKANCVLLLGFCDGRTGNPVAVVSSLYRSGRLHAAGQASFQGRRLDVIAGTTTGPADRRLAVRLLVTPRSAVPVEITTSEAGGRAATLTATISQYEQLPLTKQTRSLLVLSRPHGKKR
jgi:hypothetical protein